MQYSATSESYQSNRSDFATTATMSTSSGFNYLSLPRELRDQIMQYALNPGEVCIPTRRKSPQDRPRFGVQVLATCHQAYEEGYGIWYGRNKFRLSTCSYAEMRTILDKYQKKHLAMIPEFVVEATIEDLPTGLQVRTGRATRSERDLDSDTAESSAIDLYGVKLVDCLKSEWWAKADSLFCYFPGGHEIRATARKVEAVDVTVAETGIRVWIESTALEIMTGGTVTGRISKHYMKRMVAHALLRLYIEEA